MEAAGGAELFVAGVDAGVQSDGAAVAEEACLPERRGHGGAGDSSPAAGGLKLQAVDPAEHESGVGAQHPVVAVALDTVGVDHADPRVGPDVPLQAKNVVDRVVAGERNAWIVHRGEERDAGAERLARELDRRDRLHHPAGVDQVVGRGELLDAVEEERSLLLEEPLVPRIEQQLSGVRLDLAEVRIGGGGHAQVVGDSPAGGAAHLRTAARRTPTPTRPVGRWSSR